MRQTDPQGDSRRRREGAVIGPPKPVFCPVVSGETNAWRTERLASGKGAAARHRADPINVIAFKLYRNGEMQEAFAFAGWIQPEEIREDKTYPSSLQSYLIDTGLPEEPPEV
ncbi:MAG: hypothetical protein AAGU32_14560 [Bacillota bacterium]